MSLTNEQREQVRLSLLRYGLGGFTASLARQYLISEGFGPITLELVNAEIQYLADPDKNFLRSESKAISPEIKKWKITAAGRDYLAEQGIV